METVMPNTTRRQHFRRTPRAEARDAAASRVRKFDAQHSDRVRDSIRKAIQSVTRLVPSRD